MRKKNIFKVFFITIFLGGLLAGTLLTGWIYFFIYQELPSVEGLTEYHPARVSQFIATGGPKPVLIAEFFKERRIVVSYKKIPKNITESFLAAEDDNFFTHSGIEPKSILRAFFVNLKAGHIAQGGSTITQQVAKSFLLSPEKSLQRKLKEILLAFKIEAHLTKAQILELYLNEIYFGQGYYGVAAAAQGYFRKKLSDLNLAERALLAGLPQAPSKYNPMLHPELAKERQNYVLRRMVDLQKITEAQAQAAYQEPLILFLPEALNLHYAPYYVEHVRKNILEHYGEKVLYEDGIIVKIPLHPTWSQIAHASLTQGIKELDKRQGYRGALKRLKSPQEQKDFLTEQWNTWLQKKTQRIILNGKGEWVSKEKVFQHVYKASQPIALHEIGRTGETQMGVIQSCSENNKSCQVRVGPYLCDMPYASMQWAKKIITGKKVSFLTSLTDLFLPGDVIEVRLADPKLKIVDLDQQPITQGALVSLDLETGKILTMTGGLDFKQSEFNRVTQASRQTGSAFKPFIYATAIEKGFTPASIIVDAPLTFKDQEGMRWKPGNYEEKFYGDTTLRYAFIKSRNIPTIKLAQDVGLAHIQAWIQRVTKTNILVPDLSVALGSIAMTPLELAQHYAIFPRLGHILKPIFLSSIETYQGEPVFEEKIPLASDFRNMVDSPLRDTKPEESPSIEPIQTTFQNPQQALDPRVAYLMTHLMRNVVQSGTGYAAHTLMLPIAGKTGTTNDSMDAWFIGFTQKILTAVWVGNDEQKSIGASETGASAALPIWLSFMKKIYEGKQEKPFLMPKGIVFEKINPATGKPVTKHQSGMLEAFIEGTQPSFIPIQKNTHMITPKKRTISTDDIFQE